MKLNKELEGLGFKEPIVRDKEWNTLIFTNELFKYKIELFDDGSWNIISLPYTDERTIVSSSDVEIIAKVMKQLGHDEEFWKGFKEK